MENFTKKHSHDMAIIGMAAKLPEAENYQQFWQNLIVGKASIRHLPVSRKRLVFSVDENQKYADYGYLEGIDLFDPPFFKTLPQVAKFIDPSQRLLLEIVNNAIEDAGYQLKELARSKVGVFLSDFFPEYYQYLSEKGIDTLAGNLPANLAGRIAYVNGFTGPALMVDTACSSSLVALHLARESIAKGDCQLAIVGGASLKFDLPIEGGVDLGINSPSGKCSSFSQDADGTVGGEGVIAMIIKPLERAKKDRDHLHAVIKGSAVNQDGSRSNGLAAPSPLAQKEVIQSAWKNAEIDPRTISYIETHGSATKLGDPIEITGLNDAFREFTSEKECCLIGAVKPNIGHLGNLAGLASLVKTVLCLKNKQIPPLINFEKPNPLIDFSNSAVYINTELQEWKVASGELRRAGVSSFGLSGTNCHLVLEEAPLIKSSSDRDSYHLYTISGSSKKLLENKLDLLYVFLEQSPAISLADLSFTLNCGRRQYPEWRSAFIAATLEEFTNNLLSTQLYQRKAQLPELSTVLIIPDFLPKPSDRWVNYQKSWLPVQRWLSECQQLIDLEKHPRAAYFAEIYALTNLWIELAKKPKSIIGWGVGERVSAVLKKRKTLENALTEISNLQTEVLGDLKKLEEFIELQLKKGCNLFLNFSAEEKFDHLWKKVFRDKPEVIFHSINLASPGESLLTILADLYTRGYDFNWPSLALGRRIPLPTPPYEKRSYWYDLSQATAIPVRADQGAVAEKKQEANFHQAEELTLGEFDKSKVTNLMAITEEVALIWQRRLGLENLSLDADFIELGGDSIRGMLLVNDIKKYFGIALDIAHLLNFGTIRALSEKIFREFNLVGQLENTQLTVDEFLPLAKPVKRTEEIDYFQLSPSQKNLWLVHQMNPEEIVYNEPMALILHGVLNYTSLKKAMQKMVDRHSVLRTFFTFENGEPLQGVYHHLPISIELSEQQFASLEQHVDQKAQIAFDLEQAPLFRLQLIKLSETKHLFIFVIHHIIFDGWSILVFMREICQLYAAEVKKQKNPLPKLGIKYHDFAHWQNQQLRLGNWQAGEEYWLNKLAGELPVLNLPTDFSRPVTKDFSGSSIYFNLPPMLSEKIKLLSKESGNTLFVTLLTFFQILLLKYSRQDEFLIGTPSANRPHDQLWGLIGFFVNTFVIRQSLDKNDSVAMLLKKTKANLVNAYKYKDYPFTELVKKLSVKRDPSRGTLFDVMYVFHNLSSMENSLEKQESVFGGITFEPFPRQEIVSDYDLKLELEEEPGQFAGKIEYSTQLFTQETIERFAAHFVNLAERIVTNPEIKLANISILTPAEKEFILRKLNDTKKDFPSDQTMQQFFIRQALKRADQIAAIFAEEYLTYRQLDEQSNRLARVLRQRGIGPGSIVGLMVKRSLEMLIGIYGIVKAGGAYLPIDPDYPQTRISYMLESSQTKLLLIDYSTEEWDQLVMTINILDQEVFAQVSATELDNLNQPTDLLYVIYTSGSTGRPKGVMIEHRSLINYLYWMQKTYPLDSDDVLIQKTTFAFDISVTEIFWWTLAGAKLVLIAQGGEKEPLRLINTIWQHQVTVIQFVPTMLNAFLDYLESQPVHLEKLSSLSRIFSLGEPLKGETIKKFHRLFPKNLEVCLTNQYGPTETTIADSYYDCLEPLEAEIAPLGYPMANLQLYVVDEQLQLNPLGVPGEICIGGVGLARGYLNDPQLTAEKFISVEWTANQLIYLTGDLGKFLADGRLEFLGRLDHQVKIRGYRIELGEIEAILAEHSLIQDSVALVKEDRLGDKHLIVYIATDTSHLISVQDVHDYLAKSVPEYMLPQQIIFLDQLPTLPNGKVDRKTLLERELSLGLKTGEYYAPRNELEASLAKSFVKILGYQRVGVYDNFFELGGDSIKAIQLAAEANKIGLDLEMSDIITYQTIDQIHSFILQSEKKSPKELPKQVLIEGETSLTPIQEWFFSLHIAKPEQWTQSIFISLREIVDVELLEAAFNLLLEHHDTLRLIYHAKTKTMFYHNIMLRQKLIFKKFDLSALSVDDQRERIVELGDKMRASLDLERGPLLDVGIFDLGTGGWRLLLTIHHLLIDGVSWRILLEDLVDLYCYLAEGREVQLPPKTTSYKRWADQLSNYCTSEELWQEEAYWRQFTYQPYKLPVELTSATEWGVDHLTDELSVEETELLLTKANTAFNTNINDLLLTALIKTLTSWLGQSEHVIMMEGHGRQKLFPELNINRTVGWFTAVYPLKLILEENGELREQIKLTKEQLRAVPHGGIGYGILRYLRKAWGKNDNLESTIMFNYLGQFAQEIDNQLFSVASEACGDDYSPLKIGIFQLEIIGVVIQNRLQLSISYLKEQYQQKTIQKLLTVYLTNLREIIQYCTRQEITSHTPSDFQMANLNQGQLDQLSAEIETLLEG